MQRIIKSLGLLAGAAAVIGIGATGAFFSDTETSSANTFQAGAIDLKIDNDSYYNGNRCTNIGTEEVPNFVWQGTADFPKVGDPCDTSWGLDDLDNGHLFFNFNDLKPDDEGEDTISLHVENDAWACMDLTLTSDDDKSSNDPELGAGDAPEDPNDAWDGELGKTLQFFWWADDGDNVYEEGEEPITDQVQSLADLAPQGGSFSVTLADAFTNVWDPGNNPNPLPGGETVYIAKAWCLGDLTLTPVAAGTGVNPSVNPGVTCDGTFVSNDVQTDGVELNVTFFAVQARNNPNFRCEPPDQGGELVTLTVNKVIVADTAGIGVEDFELHIDGPIPGSSDDQIVQDNVAVSGLLPGQYHIYEVTLPTVPPGTTFTTTFDAACDAAGNVTANAGEDLVCTINNVENVTLVNDNFGAAANADVPNWNEPASDGTVASIGTGSPNGGAVANIDGADGWICRTVNSTGITNLKLSYEWQANAQANAATDDGIVEFKIGGLCSDAATTGVGWTNIQTQNLNIDGVWHVQATSSLPAGTNNANFMLRFRAHTSSATEDFRVDNVVIAGQAS